MPNRITILRAMEADIRHLVQTIHDTPYRLVFVTAGAGTQALSNLLGVAGASRTLLEALVPYNEASFDEFLGQTPEKYVTAATAKQLAGRAFTRARWLESEDRPSVGLACTATIITDRPKKGQHRAHIAAWQNERLVCYDLTLHKGARDRDGEENVVSRVMLQALAEVIELDLSLDVPLVEGDHLETETMDFANTALALHKQDIHAFGIGMNGRIRTLTPPPPAILSGSFNPLHDGHLEMGHAASELLGQTVAFELSAVNVDKPPLAPDVVLDRMAQFAGRYTIYASNAPTFLEKARLYPGTTFVVGFDTAVRILHPRYYQNSPDNMLAALADIREQGCRFLVAGRADEHNNFLQLDDLDIPNDFSDLFRPLPAQLFRRDVSSTELRQKGVKASR